MTIAPIGDSACAFEEQRIGKRYGPFFHVPPHLFLFLSTIFTAIVAYVSGFMGMKQILINFPLFYIVKYFALIC